MELTVNQRLKLYIESKKINPTDVYFKIGSSRTEWSGWVNSGKAISLLKLTRILELFEDLNARWLITGHGSMMNGDIENTTTQESTLPENSGCNNPVCLAQISGLKREIELQQQRIATLEEFNEYLKKEIDDWRKKGEPPHLAENKPKGSVEEKVRRTG